MWLPGWLTPASGAMTRHKKETFALVRRRQAGPSPLLMSSTRDGSLKAVGTALAAKPELAEAVAAVIRNYPHSGPVFQEVIEYFTGLKSPARPTKRTKTVSEDEVTDVVTEKVKHDIDGSSHIELLYVSELSFLTPLRKKLNLKITTGSIEVSQPGDGKLVVEVPFSDMTIIAILPVPEKAAKMYNFCIFRKSEDAVVFTIPDTAPTNAAAGDLSLKLKAPEATYKSAITTVLRNKVPKSSGLQITEPSLSDFTSANPQPHRKTEPATHVVAHRGSKEGYLFFLPTGFVYGFKRPLLYIPLERVASVTYNDILQRTFNLTVTTTTTRRETGPPEGSSSSDTVDIEFSMIDIAEHDRVDKYVRKYGLNDASLSESRKARMTNTNPAKPLEKDEMEEDDDDEGRVTPITHPGTVMSGSDEEEEDVDFQDDASHGGSTLGSDESDGEEVGGGGSETEESGEEQDA